MQQRDRMDILDATDRQPERDAYDDLVPYGSGRSASLAFGEAGGDIEDRKNGPDRLAQPRIELIATLR